MNPILIFDYDGTIHDTIRIYEPAFRDTFDWLVKRKIIENEAISSEQISSWLGLNVKEMWQSFQPNLKQLYRDQAGERIGRYMVEQIKTKKAYWYPYVEQVLDELKNKGYRMIVLSNCKIAYREANWKAFDMGRWFEAFYDCETFNFAPKTKIIQQIKKDYPGEYVVIGDRRNDMECAREVGAFFIGCQYGFGTDEELKGSDCLIDNIKQLPFLKCHPDKNWL